MCLIQLAIQRLRRLVVVLLYRRPHPHRHRHRRHILLVLMRLWFFHYYLDPLFHYRQSFDQPSHLHHLNPHFDHY
jgi:hypothetical protein